MYKNKRVAAIILARRGSSRLKDKMLLPFGNVTVIDTVIERLKKAQLIDNFVLATSNNPADDVFKDIASKYKIGFGRGSEDDVVSRMLMAAKSINPMPDIIVRGCADNPLLMPTVIDEAIVKLVDTNADVITPFELNTYPFGYSMVVMTMSCLKRIDFETKERPYREHVENYCFEFYEKFKIVYHKAPYDLHLSQLNLTLDDEADYNRLKSFNRLLEDVPVEYQHKVLIKKIKGCKIGIILTNKDFIKNIGEIAFRYCNCPPKVFCLSRSDTIDQSFINISNGVKNDQMKVVFDDSINALLDNIKCESFDLIISSVDINLEEDINARLGVFFVSHLKDEFGKKYSIKNKKNGNNLYNNVFKEPILIDFRQAVFTESCDGFLSRIIPVILTQLIAGPVRPGKILESLIPPENKKGSGTRRGFINPRSVYFPSIVLVELVENINYKNNLNRTILNDALLDKLIDEIGENHVECIVVGIFSDPQNHPEFKSFIEKLVTLIGQKKINIWPECDLYKNVPLVDAVFQQIVLSANGTIKYSVHDITGSSIVGDFSKISILESWQSKKMQQIRVDLLNSKVY